MGMNKTVCKTFNSVGSLYARECPVQHDRFNDMRLSSTQLRRLIAAAICLSLFLGFSSFVRAAEINLEDREWMLLTVPANADNQTIETLFADDLSVERLGVDWQIFVFDAENQAYFAAARSDALTQGLGFWIIQATGASVTIDIPDSLPPGNSSVTPACASASGCFQADLAVSPTARAWSILGAPFGQAINVEDIRLRSSEQACLNGCLLDEAINNGSLDGNQWLYDAGSASYRALVEQSTLQPWQAFWAATRNVSASNELSLLLPNSADIDAGPFNPGPQPTAALRPNPGELSFFQLPLTGLALGEAAAIIGPDGTLVLLDVGNFTHDDIVRDFVRNLNTRELTPERGYPRQRGDLEVDWIIVTHFHADHSGAYNRLMNSSNSRNNLNVTKGVVHRGFTDLGSGITESNFLAMCSSLRGRLSSLNYPMCRSDVRSICDVAAATQTYPAIDCRGLFDGDLDNSFDDSAGQPSSIELGNGARITFIAASNHASNGVQAIEGRQFGVNDNGYENARCLAGLVTYGNFHYHFGGDMTGSGRRGDPDVETHLVEVSGPVFWGPLGVDVTHVHHHARNTSSNTRFVDAVAPNDGLSRNAVAGISPGHRGSPQRQTLRRWLDNGRLGEGRLWATQSAGGSSHPRLTTAGGQVIVQTVQAGRGYWMQAAGSALMSQAYESVR